MRQNPLTLMLTALLLWLAGRLRRRAVLDGFHRDERGERFLAFRRIELAPAPGSRARPAATFQVRFRFRSLSASANRVLSLLPIPLIVAQPGFRSKTWLLGDRSGDFMGFYEFDSLDAARAYWSSLPLRMMRRRAAPGSLTHEVHGSAITPPRHPSPGRA